MVVTCAVLAARQPSQMAMHRQPEVWMCARVIDDFMMSSRHLAPLQEKKTIFSGVWVIEP
jgi:hypothetical protein